MCHARKRIRRAEECKPFPIGIHLGEKGASPLSRNNVGLISPLAVNRSQLFEDELGTELIHRTSRSIARLRRAAPSTNRLCGFSMTSKARRHKSVEARRRRKASSVSPSPTFARLHMVSKLPALFAAYPDIEMAASESPKNEYRGRLRSGDPVSGRRTRWSPTTVMAPRGDSAAVRKSAAPAAARRLRSLRMFAVSDVKVRDDDVLLGGRPWE
jgi:hypothetical protein